MLFIFSTIELNIFCNIIHKKSQEYLIKYQKVIIKDFLVSISKSLKLDIFQDSVIGIPHRWDAYKFIAGTPVFTHIYRSDKKCER